MEVKAHVVTIRNAAMADNAELLNPLLEPDAVGLQQPSTSALLCNTGWTGIVEVEAHVVTIKNAAMAGDARLPCLLYSSPQEKCYCPV